MILNGNFKSYVIANNTYQQVEATTTKTAYSLFPNWYVKKGNASISWANLSNGNSAYGTELVAGNQCVVLQQANTGGISFLELSQTINLQPGVYDITFDNNYRKPLNVYYAPGHKMYVEVSNASETALIKTEVPIGSTWQTRTYRINVTTQNNFELIFTSYDSNATLYSSIFLTNVIIVNVPFPVPWGAYIAGHPNNTTTSLYDFTGNGRNATMSGVTLTSGSGDGASASIPFLTGTSTSKITWPTGSIPTTFTVCSITRYIPSANSRNGILDADGKYWLHGHWGGYVGIAYYEKFLTNNSSTFSPNTNWAVICGTNGTSIANPNNFLVNGVGYGTDTGGSGLVTLTINNGMWTRAYADKGSDFAFQQVLIWNTVLTLTQMSTISTLLNTYLFFGSITYPWPGGPTYGSVTSSVPATYTYNINNTGLLQYYKFDSDYVNYANGTGVVDGGYSLLSISTTNTKLSSGSLYFPGSSSQFFKASNPSLSTTGGMTFAIWAKFTRIPTFNSGSNFRLFDYATGSNTSNIVLYFVDTPTLGATKNQLTLYTTTNYLTTFTLEDNNWHHYCATISANNTPTGFFTFNVYVDGVNVLSSTVASSNYPTSTTSLTSCLIGQSNWTAEQTNANQPINYFNQALVFNRALAPFEISYLMNYPTQVNFTSAITTPPIPYAYNINNTGLLQYYPFNTDLNNYSTGTSVAPSSKDTNANYSVANTKTGAGSVYFGPSNTNGFGLPVFTLGTAGITVAMWIKFVDITTRTNQTRIFEFANGTGNSQQFFSLVTNSTFSSLIVSLEGSLGYSYSYSMDTNWHHYCISINSSGQIIIYVDGVQLGTINTYASYSSVYSSTLTTAQIGGPTPVYNAYSVGMKSAYMNQFLVFNRVITATELSYLVNYPSQVGFSIAPTAAISSTVISTTIYPCFKEGTRILRLDPETDIESYVPVESLRPGDLIRTSQNGHKAVFHIGKRTLLNPANDPDPRNRLYRLPKSISNGMTADLYITGEHCILHKSISDEFKERVRKHMGDVYITEHQYRVPACIDDRAEQCKDNEPVTIWHFALENHSIYRNYGVYANGLLVESCSIQYLTEMSNMELVD